MQNQTEIKKLEQGRAEFAYKCVKEGVEKFKSDTNRQKEYRSYSSRIPTMILTNGLGQTLAFVNAKAESGNAYELLYKQITDYFKSEHIARIKMPSDKNELIEWVVSCNSKEYRFITQELLAFLNWLKRFAEGIIEGENG